MMNGNRPRSREATTSASSRREFCRRAAHATIAAAALWLTRANSASASAAREMSSIAGPGTHPTPRTGIDGSHVLTKAQLTENVDAAPVFDMVRSIPQIADGIRCQCGCADMPGFYSLLSCYEKDGMAQHCLICQGEGRLAFRLHGEGKTLDEIRAAIDAKFG